MVSLSGEWSSGTSDDRSSSSSSDNTSPEFNASGRASWFLL